MITNTQAITYRFSISLSNGPRDLFSRIFFHAHTQKHIQRSKESISWISSHHCTHISPEESGGLNFGETAKPAVLRTIRPDQIRWKAFVEVIDFREILGIGRND